MQPSDESGIRMLEFRALGPLAVVADDGEVGLGGPRQRRLVAMLLAHCNTVVSSDRLAEAVFAGAPTPAAGVTLRSYVARLRRSLDSADDRSATVVTRAPGYVLQVPEDAVDVARFERALRDGSARLRDDALAAAEVLRGALALWRGDAYGEWDDEDWIRPEAQRLAELRWLAHERLVDAELAAGRAAEVVPLLERLVAEQPLRDAFHERLVVALYRCGRQADALRASSSFRAVLAEELGLDPTPALVELERRVLTHDPTLRGEEEGRRVVRGYRLGERLGTGHEGTVHAATVEGLDRDLAVRVFRAEIADHPEFVRSFESDVRGVASLHHEAVVPIHDYWREPGAAFLVMRRMRGGTLQDRLDGVGIDDALLRALVARVGGALAEAAARGVAHGHVVASSVLHDAAGTPFLSDFVHGSRAPTAVSDVRGFAALVGACAERSPHGAPTPPRAAVAAEAQRVLSGPDGVVIGELVDRFVELLAGGAPDADHRPQNPYKALRAFDEPDASDFFGRERLADELAHRLERPGTAGRLVLVVGASGSGKSSVVRAGLLPRVRGRAVGSTDWFVATMVPGSAPWEAFTDALRHVAVADVTGLADALAAGRETLDAALRRVLAPNGELLLVVDQLEELFLLASASDQRAFLDGLVHAIAADASRLRVVATLRADHFHQPLGFPRFAALVADATLTVPAMSAGELDAAIVGPAARHGLRVEPALAAELVASVVDQPSALPALQFTLFELAERSESGELTIAAAHALGGVDGAIAEHAEHVFVELSPGHQETSRHVFERLVAVSTEHDVSRRRTLRAELAAVAPDGGAEEVVDAWVAARLLTLDLHPATRAPTVELAHEALLTQWPRLRSWVEQSREAIVVRGRVAEDAARWEELTRDDGAVYRGMRLDHALATLGTDVDALPQREREFLDASRERRAAELHEAAEHAARQARAHRRLRIQVVVVAIALVVASVGGFVAVAQRDRAQRERSAAAARELAAAALAQLEVDPERSVLLALEAVGRAAELDDDVRRTAEDALHQAVTASRVVLSVPGVGGAVAWSPDGRTFVTEGPEESGLIDIRDATDGHSVRAFRGDDVDVNAVAFSPDGALVASVGDDGVARLFDPRTGALRHEVEGSGVVFGPSFSPDGRWFAASWLWDGMVRVLDLETMTVLELPRPDGPFSTSFSPDGRIVMGTSYGSFDASIVDVATGEVTGRLVGHTGLVNTVAWSPDGRWIATTSTDATARIWSATTGRLRHTLAGHAGDVRTVAWSPDSGRVVTGSADGTAKVWSVSDTASEELLALSARDTVNGVVGVAFSPDGERVMVGDQDINAVKVFDVGRRGDAEWLNLPAVAGVGGSAVFTPDGEAIATSSHDGKIELWGVERGERIATLSGPGAGEEPFFATAFAVDVSAGGERLLASGRRGPPTVWNLSSGREEFRVRGDGEWGWVHDVAWSPDGRFVVTTGEDARGAGVMVADRSGDVVGVVREQTPNAIITSARLSPDNRYLVTARRWVDRPDPEVPEVAVWDWRAGTKLHSIDTSSLSVGFDRSGERIISANFEGGRLDVWDAHRGTRLATMVGHTGRVLTVSVHPDGERVATGGIDGTARIWDLDDGTELAVLRGHRRAVTSVGFSPDGTRLVSVGEEGVTRVWAVATDDLVALAEREVTRTLTDEECRTFLHTDGCDPGS